MYKYDISYFFINYPLIYLIFENIRMQPRKAGKRGRPPNKRNEES